MNRPPFETGHVMSWPRRPLTMPHVLLAALLVASSTATAQTPVPDGGTPAAAPQESAPAEAPPPAPAAPASNDGAVSREELEQRLEATRQELREDIRAQTATQAVANNSDWQEEWTEEKRKLELFTLDGYLRVRPTLFYKFDLGKFAPPSGTPSGRQFWTRSPRTSAERTQAGANMRFRLDPSFNVSEDVRVKVQVDALDNILLGSNPDSAYSGDGRNTFTLFSENQTPSNSAVNAFKDSIHVRRAYGEVTTPVGILRFGRMGSHWGVGMLRNDGNCLDCDYGDTVDRIQFVTEPFAGWYITPMIDFNAEGLSTERANSLGEPVDLTQSDDSHSLVLAIARRDTEQQQRAKLDNNQGVLNYGLYFTYRTQRYATLTETGTPFEDVSPGTGANPPAFVPRGGTLYVPDLWFKYAEKKFRIEAEIAAQLGSIDGRALTANDPTAQSLRIAQFGGVLQTEFHVIENKLHLGVELGFASGDKAPGFGNYPGRTGSGTGGNTTAGDVEGRQYSCDTGGCGDNAIRNFRFNRDYRVDLILWRSILNGVTDAFYVKPGLKYSIAEGFDVFGSVIYSQAFYAESTPSSVSRGLGLEADIGARYITEDGFLAGIDYGILFPLSGLKDLGNTGQDLSTAHAVRGTLAIKF
ncbi:TIGR04551 family protein [Corallococcus sicarius]|uniref:TIGR04551 family protein n=2 Tax=Corallococcus sicarius TaxID=2316726 RepID=A0A3A8N3F5_9BACT|nr:TIGR04551 family protein [Corallococcus sicarius]